MITCQFPITLYIEGEAVKMPCGHCKYCLQQKANRYTQQISLEFLTSPCVLFCTLTYSTQSLPTVNIRTSFSDTHCHEYIKSLTNFSLCTAYDNKLLNSHKFSKYDKSKNYQSGIVPVLCRSHVTLWLKRVRRWLQYHNLGKIRYYYCGEYGHKFGRPHYHALLFCENQNQASKLQQIIPSLWKHGLVDMQRARTACARYLGSYLSGSYNSKFGSRSTAYPPFNSHSNRLGYKGIHIQYIDKIVRAYREGGNNRSVFRALCAPLSLADGTISTLPLWSSFTRTLLPKCVGFSRFSINICRRLYNIFYELVKVFGSKQKFLNFWFDYNSGLCKSSYTISQVNFTDFLTEVYCTTTKNDTISKAILEHDPSDEIKDKFSKWLDKVISVSKSYLKASDVLGISTYQLVIIIKDFYDAQNYESLLQQLSDFEETQFGPEEMVYTYCNLPNYPVYLHHKVPDIVISKRNAYEVQIQKSIFKKSHLF